MYYYGQRVCKREKTMGNTIRTMVSTDNIDEYVEEIREVQAA